MAPVRSGGQRRSILVPIATLEIANRLPLSCGATQEDVTLKRTPWFLVLALAVALVVVAPAAAGLKTLSSWSDPNLLPVAKQKVLVLAMVQEDVNKRVLEDTIVKALAGKKIEALPAYRSLAAADLASAETVRAKARELGVDAGIVIRVTGQSTHLEAAPQGSVSVGIGGGGGGMFGAFIGTSVPVGGGTKTVHTVTLKAEYYREEVHSALWLATYGVEIGGEVQPAANDLSKTIVKQLKKAKAIQ